MGYFDKLKDLANKLGENVTSTLQQQYSQQPIAPPPPLPNAAPPAMPVMPSVPQQSSTQIYNNQLEALIEAALADGVLTEKEKQILFKKAQMQGIDLDEFEMVLEAKLFEKRKSMQAVVSQQTSAAPRSNKYGDVRKCPSCGAMVESFSVRCPECGFEFNNVNVYNLRPRYMHQPDYWRRLNDPAIDARSELFAHISAAQASKKQQEYMREYFPNSFKTFTELMEKSRV